jgi:hypothetical protein
VGDVIIDIPSIYMDNSVVNVGGTQGRGRGGWRHNMKRENQNNVINKGSWWEIQKSLIWGINYLLVRM